MIDFTEISPSNTGSGQQDQFEIFASSFLEVLGFKIIKGPNRGPDGGTDLIACELSPLTSSVTIWMVSAKHYAHSGRSVYVRDEVDITDRVNQSGADGFLAFYSTLPSSGLEEKLNNLKREGKLKKFFIFNQGVISKKLLTDTRLLPILKNFFPRSYNLLRDRQKGYCLQLKAWTGFDLFEDKVTLEAPSILDSTEEGSLLVLNQEMESVMAACFIAQKVANGDFGILKPFVSFNPTLWKHLRLLISDGRIDGKLINEAIAKTTDSIQVRLLISIAGHGKAFKAAESICKQVLFHGRHHDSLIKQMGFLVTPFFDVAKRSLAQVRDPNIFLIQEYKNMAKANHKWKEYNVFKYALESKRD